MPSTSIEYGNITGRCYGVNRALGNAQFDYWQEHVSAHFRHLGHIVVIINQGGKYEHQGHIGN